MWFVRRGSQRSEAKGMAPERRRVGLRRRRKGVGEGRVKQRRREEGRGTERNVEAGHRRP